MRARQGKLKSIKLGRNWVTTREWLQEYLQGNGNDHPVVRIVKSPQPPENLPVEPEFFPPEKVPKKNIFEIFKALDFKPRTSFVFAFVL